MAKPKSRASRPDLLTTEQAKAMAAHLNKELGKRGTSFVGDAESNSGELSPYVSVMKGERIVLNIFRNIDLEIAGSQARNRCR